MATNYGRWPRSIRFADGTLREPHIRVTITIAGGV